MSFCSFFFSKLILFVCSTSLIERLYNLFSPVKRTISSNKCKALIENFWFRNSFERSCLSRQICALISPIDVYHAIGKSLDCEETFSDDPVYCAHAVKKFNTILMTSPEMTGLRRSLKDDVSKVKRRSVQDFEKQTIDCHSYKNLT